MIKRCAIYTRKSTEEGLDQSFNSLDAQREACENYILSQKSEGWRAIKTRYDDGGISGGHMDRPALQLLMSDIDQGRVDIVIVYKVDRLTRSLTDFAKLVEKFDKHEVSFVSVTQAFNTSNSMGRLTLNVLLSFAQFEREVGAERVRDKIAASRKKGIWTGGKPPLGYDNIDKNLVVNEREAEIVRKIYKLYEDEGCVRTIVQQAAQNNWRSKKRKNGTGGNLLTRGPIYHMLKNPVYAGLLKTGGNLYLAQHDALIPRDQWERIQGKLKERAQRQGKSKHQASPLTGLLYWKEERLTPDHTIKSGKRYRYYVSSKTDDQTHAHIRLKASDVETAVIETLSSWITTSDTVMNDIAISGTNTTALQHIKKDVHALSSSLKKGNHHCELTALLKSINRIDLNDIHIRITLNPRRLFNDPAFDTALKNKVIIQSPCTLKKRGHELRLLLGEQAIASSPDKVIINNIILAHRLKTIRFDQPAQSWIETLKHNDIDPSTSHRFLRYAFLAPDIVEAFLDGKVPIEINAEKLKNLSELPTCWDAQRRLFGVAPLSPVG